SRNWARASRSSATPNTTESRTGYLRTGDRCQIVRLSYLGLEVKQAVRAKDEPWSGPGRSNCLILASSPERRVVRADTAAGSVQRSSSGVLAKHITDLTTRTYADRLCPLQLQPTEEHRRVARVLPL